MMVKTIRIIRFVNSDHKKHTCNHNKHNPEQTAKTVNTFTEIHFFKKRKNIQGRSRGGRIHTPIKYYNMSIREDP